MLRVVPCTIFSEGLYLGLLSCFFLISAPSLSRMLFAMAVPSILVAVILSGLLEKWRPKRGFFLQSVVWKDGTANGKSRRGPG